MRRLLEIDGHAYNVPIKKLVVSHEILDGEGTERSRAPGWPMIRDPNGTIINLEVEFGMPLSNSSGNSDFIQLWNKIMSLGLTSFVRVRVTLPVGELLDQNMYAVPSPLNIRRVDEDGTVYSDGWTVKFIAEKAYNI